MTIIFIDHNNYNYVSFSCSGKVPTLTANDYEKHLREILEEVRKKIPRVFVNVVQVFNLSMVWLLTKTGRVVYLAYRHVIIGNALYDHVYNIILCMLDFIVGGFTAIDQS